MSNYIVTNARAIGNTSNQSETVDIEIRDGVIDRIVSSNKGDPSSFDVDRRFDAEGKLVTPPLIECHTHLYGGLTAGNPRWNQSGTLEEGWRLWDETKDEISKKRLQKTS